MQNNPEKIKSFSYTSYNKFIVDADIDDHNLEKDSTEDNKLQNFLETKYLFLMESVTKRKYLYPDRSKEIVIANRVSGVKNPMFTTLANSFQPFSFYNDFIEIGTKNYLNPISKGSFSKYFFWLEDSIYSYGHKVYIISFEPKKQNFDGLHGLLYINTYKYAVENVIAETSNLAEHLYKTSKNQEKEEPPLDIDTNTEPPEVKTQPPNEDDGSFQMDLKIKIQQKYSLIDSNYWFPAQLNTDIEIGDATGKNNSILKGKGRSYLTDIHLFDHLKPREFDRLAVEYEPNANKRDSTFWDTYRAEPLGPRGQETYQYLDSVGREAKIDRTLMALATLTTGKIPAGVFDIDINRLLDFNMYEKVRLGLGFHTSRRLSSFFTLGGYGAYGFGDKAFKYGGDVSFKLTKKNDLTLSALYFNDVRESASTQFYLDNDPLSSERRRHFMVSNMDKVENKEVALSFYTLKYLDVRAAFSSSVHTVTTPYRYIKNNPEMENERDEFHFTELKFGFKYAFRQKYVEILGNKVALETRYPVIWLNYTRGINNLGGGDFAYDKIDFKATKSWLTRKFGQPTITITGGWATGDTPYPVLYNGNGSYEPVIPLEAANSFQTMRLNEFLSDRYIALYYSHKLGMLKLNPYRSTPEFYLLTNIGFGSLSHPERHQNYDFKTMEKGYYESGLSIRNLYKLKGVFGFGLAGFYRYGPYAFNKFVDDVAVKITLDFTL